VLYRLACDAGARRERPAGGEHGTRVGAR
jgi:hypothetical protein